VISESTRDFSFPVLTKCQTPCLTRPWACAVTAQFKDAKCRPIRPFLRGDFRRSGRCKRLRTNCIGRASGEEVGNSESAEGNSYCLHLSHLPPSPLSSGIRRRTRAKHGKKYLPGLERPPRFGWQRSGVAPAQHGVLPVSKSIAASCATSAFSIISVHRGGERNCEPHSEPRLSCTVHPSTPKETIEIRCHRHTSTIKEASKTEKRKRGFWPRATRIRRKCFDGRESIESPLLTREHPEGKKAEKNICTNTFFRRVCQARADHRKGGPKAQQ
jgi:hypothetical protein